MPLSHRRGVSCRCRGWDLRTVDAPYGAEDRPEDSHEFPRHQISRAFIPPCIHSRCQPPERGLPLSDQPSASAADRNPRRTFLSLSCANRVPRSNVLLFDSGLCCKNRYLRVYCGPWAGRVLEATGQWNAPIGRTWSAECPMKRLTVAAGYFEVPLVANRDSFWSSSVSVRMPQVPAIRSRMVDFRCRNSAVCFISWFRCRGSGTS